MEESEEATLLADVLSRLRAYLSSLWNQLDILCILLFALGMPVCIWSQNSTLLEVGHTLLVFSLLLYFIRLLNTLTVHKVFGPKLFMIGRMVCCFMFDLNFWSFHLYKSGVQNFESFWILKFSLSRFTSYTHKFRLFFATVQTSIGIHINSPNEVFSTLTCPKPLLPASDQRKICRLKATILNMFNFYTIMNQKSFALNEKFKPKGFLNAQIIFRNFLKFIFQKDCELQIIKSLSSRIIQQYAQNSLKNTQFDH